MKIIDLIGLLISNETMPKHIIFEDEDYYWDRTANDYICNDHDATQLFNNQYNMSNLPLFLGKTVEIIEEGKKIPEKLKKKKTIDGSFEGKTIYIYKYNEYEIGETINEIIDYLQYLKNKGDE